MMLLLLLSVREEEEAAIDGAFYLWKIGAKQRQRIERIAVESECLHAQRVRE
jgi:hypothetical protein